MLDAQTPAGGGEVQRAVAAAVVGEDALDPHSAAQVATPDLLERADGAVAALIGMDRDGRQPAVVVDRDVAVLHIRTQVDSPWTNGKIEAFWATLKSEVLDREVFRSLADAEAALERFARYYNYHRLQGEIDWCTPAERFDGTPFTHRGFQNIPALAHLAPWLAELRAAA